MNRTLVTQVAAFAAAALLTLGTVSGMNRIAGGAYSEASYEQLQSTPMADAQQVTVVAHRVRA
jgi:hypothetical protein